VGCYIWYSEERPGRAGGPPSHLLAVPNATAHSSTASVPTLYYSMWHYYFASALGWKILNIVSLIASTVCCCQWAILHRAAYNKKRCVTFIARQGYTAGPTIITQNGQPSVKSAYRLRSANICAFHFAATGQHLHAAKINRDVM